MRTAQRPKAPLLEVRDLSVTFGAGTREPVPVVEGVGFAIGAGETLGLVGESGSGKSVTALALMGLLPRHEAIVDGSILFEDGDLLHRSPRAMRALRGNRMSMIFQEPMTSLNPALTVGRQIMEVLIEHEGLGGGAARDKALDLLRRVRIPSPERRIDDYPHRLSGGQRQRVMIAMALACDPRLLIADEPTTALDVTVQAQILDLMARLRQETGAAILLVTHDLGVVAEVCDHVVVMYAGEVVERAPVGELFAFPEHPYTIGLLGSLPRAADRGAPLATIEGTMPAPGRRPRGCRFAARCPFRLPPCEEAQPLRILSATRATRCWRAPLEALAS